jgi:hypothetical protein
MRNFIFGVIVTLVVGIAGYRVVTWKHYIDKRAFYAEAAGGYLFGPSGVVNAKGESLTRQQLLDAYLELQLEQHPEWGLKFSNKK